MKTRAPAIIAIVLALLALLYALAGFLLVPYLVKREAPQLLEDRGHHLKLGEFRFNPFTLTARATDVAIEDSAGKPVFSAQEVVADLEWRSLAQRGAVLSMVSLARPVLNVEIDQQGRVNLAALARDDGKPSEGLPRFALGELNIDDGVIAFADKREPYANRFEQLSLKLSALSTLGENQSGYTLSAQTPDGAKLQWQGELSLQPLAVSGKLNVAGIALPALTPYLNTWLAVPITSGRAELDLPHRFLIKDGRPQLLLENASASLNELALGSVPDSKAAPMKLGRFSAQGIALDTLAQSVSVQNLRVEGLQAAVQRNADGSLDIASLFRPGNNTAPKKSDETQPWKVAATKLELADSTMAFTDAGSGMALALEGVSGQASELSLDKSRPLPFELAATARGGGKLSLSGKVLPAGGFAGRVEITALPVSLLQPVVPKDYRLRLASGVATLAGDLQVGGKDAKFTYRGSAAVSNVAVNETADKATAGEGTRLLGWKTLATDKLELSLAPDRVSMDELRLVAPVGRLAIAPDSSLNVRRAFPKDAAAENDAGKPAPAAPAQAGAKGESGFDVNIRRLRISDGLLDFSDQSLAQNFQIAIQELAGTFNGLSSDRSTRSQFNLEGKVGEFGFARLSGALNPFAWRDQTNFRVEFRNLDMAKISPYSIKFAGYQIASGKLSLDLRYRINASVVEGDNQAVFDQLVLGPKVDSPTAMDLPIELAVSLLKDDKGRIDIAIPVTGSLDDPQFDYGTVIRRAIGNVISRIVTAPFRALANLFGGGKAGEDVGAISFEPGNTRLLPPEREKIRNIAEGLAKRPELKVTVPGRADSEADGSRLKRAALSREIAKRAGFEVAEDESAGGLSIADARTRSAIRELYAERFGRPELDKQREQAEAGAAKADASKPGVLDRLKNLASGEPQVTDPRPFYASLMRRLRDNQPLPADALAQLAQARAQAIATALREAGVAPERIDTSTAAPTSNAQAREVRIELALQSR